MQREARAKGSQLKERLAEKHPLPAVLYYPTPAEGLRDLLHECMLPIQHMQLGNTSVLQYGLQRTKTFLDNRVSAAADESERGFASELLATLNPEASCFNGFVLRLSESQPCWSDTGASAGYYVGLDTTALPLATCMDDPDARLLAQPAIYETDAQSNLLHTVYDAALALYRHALMMDGDAAHADVLPTCCSFFQEYCAQFLPRFRPASLRHEKEWTAILLDRHADDPVRFEIIENRFIPHIRIDIANSSRCTRKIPLRCVAIDSSLPFDAAKQGLCFFFLRNGYPTVTVEAASPADPLYPQVLEWMKADPSLGVARVQIRSRIGYARAQQLVARARREAGYSLGITAQSAHHHPGEAAPNSCSNNA